MEEKIVDNLKQKPGREEQPKEQLLPGKNNGGAVKMRDILSDYWLKRRARLHQDFIKQLTDTYYREPMTADQYGTYKPGTFTFGCFRVDVYHEDGLWRIEIVSGEHGGIPEEVVRQIRYKFVPNDVWMVKPYAPREEDEKLGGVILYEIPTGSQQQDEE